MDNNNIILLLIILILFSAFFSASETAFSSVNKIRLKYLANNGNKRAAKTLYLAENFIPLLSTILIGNNIVNIVSSSLSTVLFVNLFLEAGVAYSSIVMTTLILLFGEITPKTIAKAMPEKFAMAVTPIIYFLMIILKPLNYLSEKFQNLIASCINTSEDNSYRSEEFITMVEEAQVDGDMDDHEADLITNAIEFNDLDVHEILTPRVDVIAVDINASLDDVENLFRENGFSRLPCYDGSIDNIIGVIHEKDFYYLYYNKSKTDLSQIVKEVLYTSPHIKISALLRQLQSSKTHMAIVIDEYGGTAGIITMEDILEELVGEIYDEHDEIIEYFRKIDDNIYLVKGDTNVEDMFEYFNIVMDEEYEFNTVSGWVIHNMDKIPDIGEEFSFKNMNITVTDADAKVVNEIKIEILDVQRKA